MSNTPNEDKPDELNLMDRSDIVLIDGHVCVMAYLGGGRLYPVCVTEELENKVLDQIKKNAELGKRLERNNSKYMQNGSGYHPIPKPS